MNKKVKFNPAAEIFSTRYKTEDSIEMQILQELKKIRKELKTMNEINLSTYDWDEDDESI